MLENNNTKISTYANRVIVTISGNDAVLTYKWVLPEYGADNNVVGETIKNEVTITMSKEALLEHSNGVVELFKQLEDTKKIEDL